METTRVDDQSDAAPTSLRRRLAVRALVVAAAVLIGTAVIASGILAKFSDQAELERTVSEAGVWGPIIFLGLMIVLVPLNVPGLLFVIPSTTVFGPAGGIILSLVGGFIASAIGIVGARYLGRDAFASRMPERIHRWEGRLAKQGFWGVVVARMLMFLFQPLDWLCGVSRLPLRTTLAGTFVGLVPPTVVIALTGGGLFSLLF